MSEPVMCPGCGESFPDPPAEGKCPKCGAAIGAPELSVTPEPSAEQDPSPEPERVDDVQVRRGLPPWAKLAFVVVFAVVATLVVYNYMKSWGHEEIEQRVLDALGEARRLTDEGKIGDALRALGQASKDTEKFEKKDPTRANLEARIGSERNRLSGKVKARLLALIEEGKLEEAQMLYDNGVEAIDVQGSLLDIVRKGREDRDKVRMYTKMLREAKVLHATDKFPEALQKITDLRKRTDAASSTGVLGSGKLHAEVTGLQKAWVKETLDEANQSLDRGDLPRAETWYKLARKHVLSQEDGLDRKLDDLIYNLQNRRVAGVAVKIAKVRVGAAAILRKKSDYLRKFILDSVRKKLDDDDILMVTLDSARDPRGLKLPRVLALEYREKPGKMLVLGRRKSRGTKINCTLRLTSPADSNVLWSRNIEVETTKITDFGLEGFTEEGLRINALDEFKTSLEKLNLPSGLLLH